MNFGTKGLVGIVMIVVGLVLLAPAIFPTTGTLVLAALLPATALLVLGTWLVGTSVEGQVV